LNGDNPVVEFGAGYRSGRGSVTGSDAVIALEASSVEESGGEQLDWLFGSGNEVSSVSVEVSGEASEGSAGPVDSDSDVVFDKEKSEIGTDPWGGKTR